MNVPILGTTSHSSSIVPEMGTLQLNSRLLYLEITAGLYDNREMEKTTESEEYIKLIGWLKDRRLEHNLTLRQLAAKMKITHTYIHKIEANQRRLDIYEYVQFCKALEIEPATGLTFFSSSPSPK